MAPLLDLGRELALLKLLVDRGNQPMGSLSSTRLPFRAAWTVPIASAALEVNKLVSVLG